MATTVHIPLPLLEKVDERAKALRLSRNRFIISALEKVIAEQTEWSPEFLEALNNMEYLGGEDELMKVIKQSRRSKAPPELWSIC